MCYTSGFAAELTLISCPRCLFAGAGGGEGYDCIHLHLHLSLNRGGRWGTTDDITTSFLHFSLSSTALWDLANSRPVQSLMLSFSVTVPCKVVLARPDELEIYIKTVIKI